MYVGGGREEKELISKEFLKKSKFGLKKLILYVKLHLGLKFVLYDLV